jgi:hypothetical protein
MKVKTGGRKAGSTNVITSEIRLLLKEFVKNEFEGMGKTIQSLNDKDRIDFLVKLLPFVVPKMSDISHYDADNEHLEILYKDFL